MRGFVTYGSPLDKFAALWPRIVAFEGHKEPRQIFDACHWVNIVAPSDPVAGTIERFGADAAARKDLPQLHNIRRPGFQFFGLSHVQYWRWPALATELPAPMDGLFRWLIHDHRPSPDRAPSTSSPFGRAYATDEFDYLSMAAQGLVATLLLLAGASVFAGLALLALAPDHWALPGIVTTESAKPMEYISFFAQLAPVIAAVAGLVVHLSGHYRWLQETRFNLRAAAAEDPNRHRGFKWQARCQIAASLGSLTLGLLAIACLWLRLDPRGDNWWQAGLPYAVLMSALIAMAALLQSLITQPFSLFDWIFGTNLSRRWL